MSNGVKVKDLIEQDVEELTAEFRGDNFSPTPASAVPNVKSFVKPTIKLEGLNTDGLTAEQVIGISKIVEQTTRDTIRNAQYDPNMTAQVIRKDMAPITDFSKLTMDAVYDLSVNIEAKEFFSADMLDIKLRDTNYEARWVNRNPQRLGEMLGKGFTYLVADDILKDDQTKTGLAIQTAKDAEGHFSINDVVAMKIDKATYYAALRKAHLRALSTTNEADYIKKAANAANGFMQKSEFAGDFANARASGKMKFYDPNISIA